MAREWKMRPRPVKPRVPTDATPEQIAAFEDAWNRLVEKWRANENALLAEAIGEVSRIALSFDECGRVDLAQILAVLGPEPVDEPEEGPWQAALDRLVELATVYIAQQQKAAHPCADCAKKPNGPPDRPQRVVRAPANVVVELTKEELEHLAKTFGVQYVQTALEEINRLRGGSPESSSDGEKPA